MSNHKDGVVMKYNCHYCKKEYSRFIGQPRNYCTKQCFENHIAMKYRKKGKKVSKK